MEQIRNAVIPANVHQSLARWMEAALNVQTCRREEIVNAINRHKNKGTLMQKEKGN